MGKKEDSQNTTRPIFCKKRFDCGSLRCPDEKNLSKFSEGSNFPCFRDNISLIMGKKVYSQNTNRPIFCQKRFVCGSSRCPDEENLSKFPAGSNFPCFIEKVYQNQHTGISFDHIKKEWNEANKITWREVICFEDRWFSILYIILISLFYTFILIFFAILPKIYS